MSLTSSQTQVIAELIEKHGITYQPLIDELVDEGACSIEREMNGGLSFEQALQKVKSKLDRQELCEIQSKVISSVFSGKLRRNFELKQSLFLSIGLSLWILIEYLIRIFTGIERLGPLYGILFIALIFFYIYRGLRAIRSKYLGGLNSSLQFLLSGGKISLYATIVFTLFLSFFWIVIYPDFYLTLGLDRDMLGTWKEMFISSLFGIVIEVFRIGVGFTVLVVLFHKIMPKRQVA